MIKNFKKNNKGFTLVELLVVIAIIGVLAVVAVPSLFKQVNKAKASDAVAYISAARTAAISEYAADTSKVPTAATVETLVEDRPDCIVETSKDSNVYITISEDTTNKKIIMTVKLTKKDIATQVANQLGSIAKVADDAVTVDVYKTDVTQ